MSWLDALLATSDLHIWSWWSFLCWECFLLCLKSYGIGFADEELSALLVTTELTESYDTGLEDKELSDLLVTSEFTESYGIWFADEELSALLVTTEHLEVLRTELIKAQNAIKIKD